jgi:hypothetical protein
MREIGAMLLDDPLVLINGDRKSHGPSLTIMLGEKVGHLGLHVETEHNQGFAANEFGPEPLEIKSSHGGYVEETCSG